MTDESTDPDDTGGLADEADDGDPEAADTDASSGDDVRPRMERALQEVRRECWKAATVHAVAEAAVVFLAANLVLVTVEPSWLPARYRLPRSVSGPIADALVARSSTIPARSRTWHTPVFEPDGGSWRMAAI